METYFGVVDTSQDAIKLFEACRLGLLPQTQHRLSLIERRRIRPGSVFVWNDRNGHLRRWTDGRAWGPCRIDGRFLSYQEMTGRFCKQKLNQEGASTYGFKSKGMVKRTFTSKTSNGTRFHLVAYSSPQHSQVSKLSRPTEDHQLSKITPADETYREPRPNPRQERLSSKSTNSSTQSPSKRLPTLKAILTQMQLDQMLDSPERHGKITRQTLNPILNLPNSRSSSPGTAFASASKPQNDRGISQSVQWTGSDLAALRLEGNINSGRGVEACILKEKERRGWVVEDCRMLATLDYSPFAQMRI